MPTPILAPCPTCGAPVKSGAACPRCLLAVGLRQITPKPTEVTFSEDSKTLLLSPPDLQKAAAAFGPVHDSLIGTLATTLGSRLPEKFADYELIEEIAHGGMGVVYLARQISLDRFVALKFLLNGRFSSEDLRERFRREAKAAAGLRHPNIVAVHHVGRIFTEHADGGPSEQPYYCMDFIEGRSLAEVLRSGPLPPQKAALYCRTISEAVHYAHERWVLHRDLKPSNVLIDLNDVPHITDFGLAGKMEVRSDLTATGLMIGTPGYLSPEMAAGRTNEVSAASDIYAIGAMLYECLVGRPPFLGETLQETLLRIRDQDAVPPTLINPTVPRDLDTICLKCLEKNPAHRYASAQALANDLGRWLEHKPIEARPATLMTQVGKWMRRNPSLGLLSAGVIVTLLIFSALVLVHNRHMHSLVRESQHLLIKHQIQTGLNLAQEYDFATAALWLARAEEKGAERVPLPSPSLKQLWFGTALKSLAFSQDSRRLLVTTEADPKLQIYDISTGQIVSAPSTETPAAKNHRTLLHPDGHRLIVYSSAENTPSPLVMLRDVDEFRDTAVSPDGRFLASTNALGITRLWELNPVPPQPLSLEAAILSTGYSLDDSGKLQSLTRDELQTRWKKLQKGL